MPPRLRNPLVGLPKPLGRVFRADSSGNERVVRPAGVVLAIALVGASLWYLVAPPRGEHAYRDRAGDTAEALRSQVDTARLWVRAASRGDTTGPAAAVGLEDAERLAESAAATFAQYEPPRGAEAVGSALERIATAVRAELRRLRIAGLRGDWEDVERGEPQLGRLASQLEDFRRRARS